MGAAYEGHDPSSSCVLRM
jgi:hypothetical protein